MLSQLSKVSGWPIQQYKGHSQQFLLGLLFGNVRLANAVHSAAYLPLSAIQDVKPRAIKVCLFMQ